MDTADQFAIVTGKLTARAIHLLGAGLATNLPGKIARRLAPTVLAALSKQARSGVIAVSGTNGKSTTSGLISSILSRAGFEFVHNKQGANLVTGITSTLVEACSWDGKLHADYCLFETDEAALRLIAREVPIKQVVVTNLFRDQLDRFGELDTTAKLIAEGISQNNSFAVLNADDANVSQLAPNSERLYFGIESIKSVANEDKGESVKTHDAELSYCPSCGAEISYSIIFYGQLGHWSCTKCGFTRPTPQVTASNVEVGAHASSFTLTINGRVHDAEVQLPGLFNVYNALAAAASTYALGVSQEAIRQGLKNYKTLFGRSEKIRLQDKTVFIQLIKNPAGASQAVSAVVADPKSRVLVAINDKYADGRDISWLWDADFEQLSEHKHEVVVSGVRAEDMAVRLKYTGLAGERITTIGKLSDALDHALNMVQADETLWVLPTYTCLLELQKILRARGHLLSGTT